MRSSLCACCTPAVRKFSRIISAKVRRLAVAKLLVGERGKELVVLVHRQHPVRRQALDREGASDADARVVDIGFVVEIFVVSPWRRWRRRWLFLACDARLPPRRRARPQYRPANPSPASRGISHSSHCLAEGGVEPGTEGLQGLLPASPRSRRSRHYWQWTFRVMCGTRS